MKTLALLLLLSFGAGLTAERLVADEDPVAARAIVAEVFLEGEQLLRGHTSDDGHPNVDQVWAYLPGLKLQATEAFAAIHAEQGGGDLVVLKGVDKERTIKVSISYGGYVMMREVHLDRAEDGSWRLRKQEMVDWADYRWIRRSAVEALTKKRR